MLVKSAMLILTALSLSGCAPAAVIYGGSRAETKGVISDFMVGAKPGVSSRAAAECVIAGMSWREVPEFGNSGLTDGKRSNDQRLRDTLGQQGVQTCLGDLPKGVAP